MKFEEALQGKKEIGETKQIDGLDYTVFVGPYYLADFLRWKKIFFENKIHFSKIEFTDEDAKGYSSNQEFKVYGMYQFASINSYKILLEDNISF